MLGEEKIINPDKNRSVLQIVHDFDFLHWNTKDYFGDIASMSDDEKKANIKKTPEGFVTKGV